MSVKLVGFQSVLDALRRVPKVTRAAMVEAVGKSKVELTQLIRQAAPFETGALRLKLVPSPRKGTMGFVGVESGQLGDLFGGREPSVYYYFQEFGTEAHRAQPFIRPTSEAYATRFISHIQKTGPEIEREMATRGGRFL